MAGSVNKVILIGNLGRDPEVRNFPNGGKVCNLRIATSENWKDRNTGERREKTEWHSVAIFSEPLVSLPCLTVAAIMLAPPLVMAASAMTIWEVMTVARPRAAAMLRRKGNPARHATWMMKFPFKIDICAALN